MKTCPVCHTKVFDDMPICYGCMHRFEDEGLSPQSAPPETLVGGDENPPSKDASPETPTHETLGKGEGGKSDPTVSILAFAGWTVRLEAKGPGEDPQALMITMAPDGLMD